MKAAEMNLFGNDDTLIQRLGYLGDQENEPRRSFGIEIHNRLNEEQTQIVKTRPNLELGTFPNHLIEDCSIITNHLPTIEKDYRLLILSGLVQGDKPVNIQNHSHEARNHIVNWLILIHTKYTFQAETIHQAVRIFDRFLSTRQIPLEDYQRYGLTAYWMSAKMQERKVKQLKIWLQFGRGYMLDEIIASEKEIMEALEYQLISNTPQRFMFNFATFFPFEPRAFILCNYLLQLTLLDNRYLKYPSRVLALSCLYVCGKVLRRCLCVDTVSELIGRLASTCGISPRLLGECSKRVCQSLQKAPTNPLSSVYRKYCSHRYLGIARIQLGKA